MYYVLLASSSIYNPLVFLSGLFTFHALFYLYRPAKSTEMDVEGTVLLLSVFDHDVIGANDFAGMCVVACKDIPQLASPEASLTDPDAPQRKNLTLPLFRYTSETPVFAEMDARSHLGDAKAANFFKVNKNLLGHLSRLRHRSSSKNLPVK